MRKLGMDPEARLDLFVTMEAFLGYVKSLHTSLVEVMADVAAIRDAVFNDPTEIAAYRNNLKIALGNAKPLVEEACATATICWRSLSPRSGGRTNRKDPRPALQSSGPEACRNPSGGPCFLWRWFYRVWFFK